MVIDSLRPFGGNKVIVLGFDVPEKAFYEVDYVKKRPTLTDMGLNIFDDITPEDIKRLIRTKRLKTLISGDPRFGLRTLASPFRKSKSL